jgi:hypothetical protein
MKKHNHHSHSITRYPKRHGHQNVSIPTLIIDQQRAYFLHRLCGFPAKLSVAPAAAVTVPHMMCCKSLLLACCYNQAAVKRRKMLSSKKGRKRFSWNKIIQITCKIPLIQKKKGTEMYFLRFIS